MNISIISQQAMKSFLILVCVLLSPTFNALYSQHDHDGHSHVHEVTENTAEGLDIPLPASSEASSDKYEVLLKFQPVEPGEELVMTLFLSDYVTNAPVDSARVTLVNADRPSDSFEVEQEDKGIFHIHTIMPDEKTFHLDVTILSPLGPDLIRLQNVDFQHHHAHDDAGLDAHKDRSSAWFFLIAMVLLAAGLLAGKYLWGSRQRRNASAGLLLLFLLPLSVFDTISAHEGEHGPKKKDDANLSAEFTVIKESQFLMTILTQTAGNVAFENGRRFYGTVIPSPGGQAVVGCPEAGRISSVAVHVGEQVKKGQLLATVERLPEAISDINFMAEMNRNKAELEAAKKEYARLKSLEDIAAKKQIDEAYARWQEAEKNYELFNSSSPKQFTLRSPIDGIVGAFTLSEGSSVNSEQTLFTVTNLSTVFVETQAFEQDIRAIEVSKKFIVQCAEENHVCEDVSLVTMGQEFNPSNQSQRVLFSVNNKSGDFKIGEFVNVWAYSSIQENTLAVPNSAIAELEGRSVVFVKKSAEVFELRYIDAHEDNGLFTIIGHGIDREERLVTSGAYQMKLIYLNR